MNFPRVWEISPNLFFFDPELQMGANGASGQEQQIAPKNRFRAKFFLRKLWTYHFLFSPYFHRRFA
jgi:hypothetical protein